MPAPSGDSPESIAVLSDVHPAESRHEVAFVDPTVPNYQALLNGMDQSVEVILLEGGKDGLQQIADALSGKTGIDAIHLIAHGGSGVLQLGTGMLNTETMSAQYADELATIGHALSEEADILVYGCDFAGGATGQQAIRYLSGLTGADVQASTDPTGSPSLGGDWDLEVQTGPIETRLAINEAIQAQWIGLLDLTPSGGETRVNTTTTGTQSTNNSNDWNAIQNIARNGSGATVVVWENASNGHIYAQRYNGAGVAQGGEIQITTNANDDFNASVAIDEVGNFTIVWERDLGGSNHDIYARQYDATGVARGTEFLANETTTNRQERAHIAMDANGNFVVVWESNHSGGNDNVYAQRYDSSGTKLGGNFLVNTTTAGNQDRADVAMNATGEFVVVWEGETSAGSNSFNVYGQRYNAAGVAQGGEFQVNTATSGNDEHPNIDMTAGGSFVVAWDRNTSGAKDIYAQRYNSSGVAQGGEIQVTSSSFDQDVAMSDNGDFLMTWTSDGQDVSGTFAVYARQYSTAGIGLTSEMRVNTTTTGEQDWASTVYDGNNVMIVWSGNGTGDSSGIFYQRYTETGSDNPPLITSNGGGAAASLNVAENSMAVTTVTATDVDAGQTLTYRISGGADAAKFTIDSSTGVLTFVTAPNYEAPTDSGSNNVYDVTVQVTDGNGGTDTQALAVTVTNANEVPVLMVNAGSTVAESGIDPITNSELAVSDVDNTPAQLTFTIGTTPIFGHIELTTAPGVAAINFTQADIDAGRVVYVHDGSETTSDSFTFTVNDGAGGSLGSTTVTLTVTPVNDAPTITSNASVSVAENVTGVTIVTGVDVDLPAQSLTYSISGGADQALFTIDGTSGALNFVAPRNFEVPTDANGDNVYVVQVRVTDTLGGTSTQTVQVTITDVAEGSNPSSVVSPFPPSLVPTSPPTPPYPPTPPVNPPWTEPGTSGPTEPLPSSFPGATPPIITPTAVPLALPTAHRQFRSDDLPRSDGTVKEYAIPRWGNVDDRVPITRVPLEFLRRLVPEKPEGRDSVSNILMEKLDALATALEQSFGVDERRRAFVARITTVTGMALSAGFVVWLLRSGTLLASCLAMLPAWRHIDPLPVLNSSRRDRTRFQQEALAAQDREHAEFRGLRHVLGEKPSGKPRA